MSKVNRQNYWAYYISLFLGTLTLGENLRKTPLISFPLSVVIDTVRCQRARDQSYALYLPSTYQAVASQLALASRTATGGDSLNDAW